MTKKNLLLRFILPLLLAMILGAVVLNIYTHNTRPAELHLSGIELAPFSGEKSVFLLPELIIMSQKEYNALIAEREASTEQDPMSGECQRWSAIMPPWLLCGDPGYLQHTDQMKQFASPSQLVVEGLLQANTRQNALYIYHIKRDPDAKGSLLSRLDIYIHDDGEQHYYRYDEQGKLSNLPLSDLPQPVAYIEDEVNAGLQPTLRFSFTNSGAREATLNTVRSERVFVVTSPAQTGYPGEHVPPRLTVPAQGMSLGPENDETVILAEPVVLQHQQDKALEIPLNILDLGQGDSPGYVLVRFYLDYFDGAENQSMLLGNFLFSDYLLLAEEE
ncbi:hypothetical protein L6J37_14660 [Photobacterium sp. WH77]|uniref:Uncharacterized protein n=1 Tax=Photobacterium arenosum TaxID=2774143 RepID=A0ABR9BTG9_9GAMM|nr:MULTISPECIES: hypothetical protein [Photobacterium]MBD8515135.1 hypothetical protein [Photobacterium arenosum]MCG2838076.1 hypothetical protein [Photobacterium sp. WH77]MCG2845694.1 hypothetical protein [Photobacterium sp. WH80]